MGKKLEISILFPLILFTLHCFYQWTHTVLVFSFELGLILAGLYSTVETDAVICRFSVHVILLTHSHSSVRLVKGIGSP